MANAFSPLTLFDGGVQGAWYDPSDYTTLFQNAAGTTPVTAVEQPVGLMRDKSGNNNHASQATATSRPVLRARYNLLTYSEQFDNAAWSKSNATVTANSTTAPDGTSTADTLIPTTTGGVSHWAFQNVSTVAASYTASVYFKAAGYGFGFIRLRNSSAADLYAWFNLSTGVVGTVQAGLTASIQSVGNEWHRCSVTIASPVVGTNPVLFGASNADNVFSFAGDGTSGIYIWGADLRTGSSAGTYQRIAAATDYATAGFLPYLAFDGTDDSFGTGSINFSATDKMSVCAGVTKLSDASYPLVVELSVNANSNSGVFNIIASGSISGSAGWSWLSRGTSSAQAQIGSGYASPITNVITGLGDISGDSSILRVNASQIASNTTDQGTGNYGNYPLFIGRRNNASLPFNGRLYSLIVAGKTVSASELASTEAYVAAKTGVTL